MSMEKELASLINDVTDDMKIRQKNETKDILEKELYDVNFKLAMDKEVYKLFLVSFICAFILFVKSLGRPILKTIMYGTPMNLTVLHIWALVLIGIAVVFCIVGPLYLKNKSQPEVKKTMVCYKGNTYHYSQITKIKVSSLNLAKVYIDGKKCFWISRDFRNYDAFIAWAKKCNVPMEQKQKERKELTEEKAAWITAGIVVLCAIIVAVLFATGIIKR